LNIPVSLSKYPQRFIFNKIRSLGNKLLNADRQTNRYINTISLTVALYNFTNNYNNSLKIYRRVAKILSSLQSEIVSLQNTKTPPPLAETPDLFWKSWIKFHAEVQQFWIWLVHCLVTFIITSLPPPSWNFHFVTS